MKLLLPLLLPLAAYASEYDYEYAAKEASRRVIFGSQNWYKRDYNPVPAGEERWGNCATYAATVVQILKERGVSAAVGECRSYWGPHAFALVTGKSIVIESINQRPVPFTDMGCKWGE